MIRRIRDLLYDQGFTISGARNKMQEILQTERDKKRHGEVMLDGVEVLELGDMELDDLEESAEDIPVVAEVSMEWQQVKKELIDIRELLMIEA